ncbi:L-2-amino-thiazoline-4-carboxylic acid hydrolase [Candidatus Bipolaricaulota bacterium]|nr:L-2-amino-thiazoline-4-carboxylic acid hydrolase [Candidatus Bipolaricaulota bacterium]
MSEQLKAEMAQRAELFRLLVDRFGVDVLDLVSQYTIDQTRRRLEDADLDSRNLNAVMELLWDQMVQGTQFQVEERSSSCLRLRVTQCLFADEMARLGATDIGDAFYCAYDFGFCQGLNPAMRFTRTKSLMKGDDCCNHTYQLT